MGWGWCLPSLCLSQPRAEERARVAWRGVGGLAWLLFMSPWTRKTQSRWRCRFTVHGATGNPVWMCARECARVCARCARVRVRARVCALVCARAQVSGNVTLRSVTQSATSYVALQSATSSLALVPFVVMLDLFEHQTACVTIANHTHRQSRCVLNEICHEGTVPVEPEHLRSKHRILAPARQNRVGIRKLSTPLNSGLPRRLS